MWFPPYGITITDNSTVNWQSTQFVGRGEPIYTYNNTERSMTLQFKVIVDHPSILNAMRNQRGPNQISINQYFGATSGKLKKTINGRLGYKYEKLPFGELNVSNNTIAKAEVMLAKEGKNVKLGEISSSFSLPRNVEPQTIFYSADTISFVDNATGNTRNGSFNLAAFINDLYDVIDVVNIKLIGNTSFDYDLTCTGTTKDTDSFSAKNRIDDFVSYIKTTLKSKAESESNLSKFFGIDDIDNRITEEWDSSDLSGCDPESVQSLFIKVQYNPAYDGSLNSVLDDNVENDVTASQTFLQGGAIPICESDYFEAMDETDRIALFKNLKQQLDFFHPAFHSMTPEGFNKRLTFLLQCTRQGPSINIENKETNDNIPNNMAFGRPPVCILRVGDFYYTKVVIDSCNISYDDNLWDLNPDGIGIQPMIATVDLNMKMIGGSSLNGPIAKLQNALSYNFFANTEVYQDIPVDKVVPKKEEKTKIKKRDVVPNPPPTPAPPTPTFGEDATYEVGEVGINSFFIMCPYEDNNQLPQFLPKCEDYYNERRFKTDVTFSINFSGTTPNDLTFITKIRDTDGKMPNGGTATQSVAAGSTHLYGGKIENIYLEFGKTYYLTTHTAEKDNDFLLVSKQVEFTENTCPIDIPIDNSCVGNSGTNDGIPGQWVTTPDGKTIFIPDSD
tara:strand:- start:132 stop:2150 length:2019 start_codon:yes stop_codon:yes gene_type:complete